MIPPFQHGLDQVTTEACEQKIAYCDKAIRKDPHDSTAYHTRGWFYVALGQYNQAIADFDKAIRLDPKNAMTYYWRGFAHCATGQYDRAIADAAEAHPLDPENDSASWELWHFARDSQAISLDPQDAYSYGQRGRAYANHGEHQRAVADFNAALRVEPQDAITYNDRALSYAALGQHDLAISDYSEAIRLNPRDPAAHYNLGTMLSALQRYVGAVESYSGAIDAANHDGADFPSGAAIAVIYHDRGAAYASTQSNLYCHVKRERRHGRYAVRQTAVREVRQPWLRRNIR